MPGERVGRGDLASRLRTHVDRLAGLIGPRHLGRPAALDAAAALIERELAANGDAVERHEFPAAARTAANLIAERRGTSRADEIVVLGAHYDTVPETPGADDNASAVAVLLEAARLTRGVKFRRTIRFVAFACEEPPHFHTDSMGSQAYARRCRERAERITAMLCLEMVGYYSDLPASQRCLAEIPAWLRWALPSRGNFLANVGNLRSWRACLRFRRGFRRATRMRRVSIVLPERIHAIRLSDNSSFWDQGHPALMLSDTSFLRNPHYHRPSDTPGTLNYDTMAAVTCGVVGGLSHLAGALK